jgi:hypothetical protein
MHRIFYIYPSKINKYVSAIYCQEFETGSRKVFMPLLNVAVKTVRFK